MAQEEFPNEYGNLSNEEVSKDLERITNNTPEKKEAVSHVRTFAKDVAEEMKSNSASVVKVALAEQERNREYEKIVKKSKHQEIIYLILIFVFVVGGAIVLATTLKQREATTPLNQPIQQEKANSIIFSESQEIVDVTGFSRSELIESLRQRIDFLKGQGITNLVTVLYEGPTGRPMNGAEFANLVGTNVPETFAPLLNSSFMVGVDKDNDFSTFLVFSFQDFDAMIGAMREWEPFFVQDMTRLLDIKTGDQGIEIFSKPFNSEILFNKESRVLRDQNQGLVVGYTFLDRNTLVIGTNLATIKEVLDRYSVQEIQ